MPGVTEILLISAVILLFFGGKKLPELMRSIGRSKLEYQKGRHEDEPEDADVISAPKPSAPSDES